MDTYEATRSTTSAVGSRDQRDQPACDWHVQDLLPGGEDAEGPAGLVTLSAHAMKMTGTSLYLGEVVNLMHNTGAGRYLPPGLVRPEHARHSVGNMTSCYTAPRDLELFAKWTCGGDLDVASAMVKAGVTSPADLAAGRTHRLLASRSPMDSS